MKGKKQAVVAQEIRKLTDESIHSAEKIAEIVEEDRNTTLSSISAITAISAQTAAGSSNVNETVKKQSESIEELDKAVELLESRAKELTEILSGFRV